MITRIFRLPNGYRTASSRITKVRMFPDRTEDPERPYLEIYESGRMVFAGPFPLRDGSAMPALPARKTA